MVLALVRMTNKIPTYIVIKEGGGKGMGMEDRDKAGKRRPKIQVLLLNDNFDIIKKRYRIFTINLQH